MRALGLAMIAGLLLGQGGCAHFRDKPQINYQTVRANPNRDSELAQKKTDQAAKFFEKGKLDKAEAALQEALVADVTYGPAHNNLGTVYFRQCKLYLAAWEYEYAIRVMPDRGEPYNNLGLVYVAAEKPERAIEMFQTARSLEPSNPEYLGNLVRAMIRRDGPSAEARVLLEELVFLETRPEWRSWAREQLAVGKHAEAVVGKTPGLEMLPPATPLPTSEIPLPSTILPPPTIESGTHFELPVESLPAPASVTATDEAI